MSQLSHSIDSSLLVRDVAGDYRPANADEVRQAARRVLAEQMRGCEALTSPQVVRDFLRVKLGALAVSYTHLDVYKRQFQALAKIFDFGLPHTRCSARYARAKKVANAFEARLVGDMR